MTTRSATIALAVALALAPIGVFGQGAKPQPSDQEIAAIIVKQSREAYYRSGHPCACPEDLARNGSQCGKRSAYSRPGGASPLCYGSDVTKGQIEDYRRSH